MILRANDLEFANEWHEMLQTSAGSQLQPFCSRLNCDYQQEYHGKDFEDVSFVIRDGDVSAGLLASVHRNSQGWPVLSQWGRPLMLCGSTWTAALSRLLAEELRHLVEKYSVREIIARDTLTNGECNPLTIQLMNRRDGQVLATPKFACSLNLASQEDALRADIRRRYKSTINSGLKKMEVEILDFESTSLERWSDCRELHIQAAARETRNENTWTIQKRMIQSGEAFAVLGSIGEELVGFNFFHTLQGYCYYAVAAAKRDLFRTLGISHSLMWRAISYAKSKGYHTLETGDVLFANSDSISSKERDIGWYKAGFGGCTKAYIEVKWTYSESECPLPIAANVSQQVL